MVASRDNAMEARAYRRAARLFERGHWAYGDLHRMATKLDGIAIDGFPVHPIPSEPPAGSTAETFGKWKPDRKHCPGCAKVARHPGEGYACAWHDAIPAAGLDTPAGSTKGVPEAVRTFVSQQCERCNDTGWVDNTLAGNGPERCPVGCADERERAAAVAGVPEGKPAGCTCADGQHCNLHPRR